MRGVSVGEFTPTLATAGSKTAVSFTPGTWPAPPPVNCQLPATSQALLTAAVHVSDTAGQKRSSRGSSQGRAVSRRRALDDPRAAQAFRHLLSILHNRIDDPPC